MTVDGHIEVRPARHEDVARCIAIRTESIRAYQGALGIDYAPGDQDAAEALLDHMRTIDPDLVRVAARVTGRHEDPRDVVGYVAASVHGASWFLGSLFVVPSAQGAGLGPRLLMSVRPEGRGLSHMTCTDALQPISNAMYARLGISPRVPLFRVSGKVLSTRATRLRLLSRPMPRTSDPTWESTVTDIGRVDRDVLGYEHPLDHRLVRVRAAHALCPC